MFWFAKQLDKCLFMNLVCNNHISRYEKSHIILNALVKYQLHYIRWFNCLLSTLNPNRILKNIFLNWNVPSTQLGIFFHVDIIFIYVAIIYYQLGKHLLSMCHEYSCHVAIIYPKKIVMFTITRLTSSLLMFTTSPRSYVALGPTTQPTLIWMNG